MCWWGSEYANVTFRQGGQGGHGGKPCEHEECTALWNEDYISLPALSTGYARSDPNAPPPGAVVCPPLP